MKLYLDVVEVVKATIEQLEATAKTETTIKEEDWIIYAFESKNRSGK